MAITASRPWEKFSWRKNCRVSFFWVLPISTYNPGQKVLGHSLFFTCFVWNLQLTGNIATASKLSIYREWTRERAAKPLAFAAPFGGEGGGCSRVTSRDSPKWSACSQATGRALTRFLPSSRTKMWPIIWARFEKECLTSKTQPWPGGGRVNLNCNFLYMKDKVSQTFCPGLYFTSGINI